MGEESTPKSVKDANRKLCKEYPFLLPDYPAPDYDYEYTKLDDMPDGWRIAFADDLLRDLKQELTENGSMDGYCIDQIKEKWGYLNWYDTGGTKRWFGEILPKYEILSSRTCIHCGKPATLISKGWIAPYCDDCAAQFRNKDDLMKYYTPIDEYFSDVDAV